jgi:hypothetical protein
MMHILALKVQKENYYFFVKLGGNVKMGHREGSTREALDNNPAK